MVETKSISIIWIDVRFLSRPRKWKLFSGTKMVETLLEVNLTVRGILSKCHVSDEVRVIFIFHFSKE